MPDTENYPASFLTLPHWRYRPQLKGLTGIYLSITIRRIAFGLLGIFIPIYIYQLTGNLNFVLLFYLIRATTYFLTTIPAAKLIGKIGPDATMFLSTLAAGIYLCLLILAPELNNALWLAPIFSALSTNLYWLPYHTAFSTIGKSDNLPENIRKNSTLARLANVFSPLIGGIIAAQFGFTPLFLISIFLLIVSNLPLFLDNYNRHEPLYNFKHLKQTMREKGNRLLFLSFIFQGMRSAIDGVVWPLILFLAIPSLTKIGGLTTITLFFSLILINTLSKIIKKFQWPIFGLGCLGRSAVWATRAVIPQPLIIALSDPLYQLSSVFVDIPRNFLIYQKGREDRLNFFTQRELSVHLGRFISLAIILFAFLLGLSWPIATLISIWAITLASLFIYKYSQQSRGIIHRFKAKFGRL